MSNEKENPADFQILELCTEPGGCRVRVKFLTTRGEWSPPPFFIKGTIEEIPSILRFLARKYGSEERFTHNFQEKHLFFEIFGRHLFFNKDNGGQVLLGNLPKKTEMVDEKEALYKEERAEAEKDALLEELVADWEVLNINRTITSKQRIQEKIESIHLFVEKICELHRLEPERIKETILFHQGKYQHDPGALLSSYRIHLPEFDAQLLHLENSSELDSRLRVTQLRKR